MKAIHSNLEQAEEAQSALDEECRGTRLEAARSADEQWRAKRQAELRRKLEFTKHLEAEGNSTLGLAGRVFGGSIFFGFTGLVAYMVSTRLAFGPIMMLMAILGVLSAFVVFLVGLVTRWEAISGRAALQRYARRNAIATSDASDTSKLGNER